MTTVTLAEAQSNLIALIHELAPGEELVITSDNQPVARLIGIPQVPQPMPQPVQRQPGSGRGELIILSDDDDHLADFAEYMP